MDSSRRRWLRVVFLGTSWILWLSRFARAEREVPPLSTSIKAVVDTLVPDDGYPGAVALDVHSDVIANIRSQPTYLSAAESGVAWLDAEAALHFSKPFPMLEESARTELLARAERSPRGSAQFLFFAAIRDEVLRRYYAHPGAWLQLRYEGPPQPLGFMDHSDRPAALDD